MSGWLSKIAIIFAVAVSSANAADPPFSQVVVSPATVQLAGLDESVQLLVDGVGENNAPADLTHRAEFHNRTPEIIRVSAAGIIEALKDGRGLVEVVVGGKRIDVPVTVERTGRLRSYNFENDIVPILSKFGCNSSGCHGKAEGQNGFKLSVFGFDPVADYRALVMEGRGRRLFPAAPDQSLLLRKATGTVPHGGGVRIDEGAPEFKTIHGWIAAGMPLGTDDDPKVARIELVPHERPLKMAASQQLRVVAHMTDGRKTDVTRLVQFQSNNDGLAKVSPEGLVTVGTSPGQVAVMATYMGAVDVFQAIIPRGEAIASYPKLPQHNFIDKLVDKRLEQLNIIPSGLANDAAFLRRVYLDLIGTLPTAEEARSFLADERMDRRERLVNELLKRPEFADYWALQWSDLLRVDRQALGHKAAYEYYLWIRRSLAAGMPMDQFAREIITAEGPLTESPQGNLFKVVPQPGKAASTISQIFLGVRIECAQCHHHPFDRWSQTDYFGMEAFFKQVKRKNSTQGEALLAEGDPQTKHPRSGQVVFAHPLGQPMPEENPQGDRRRVLADWMTAPDNPFFARNIANRVWARLMGRGLVEPVDDVRATNPPSNPELLDALAKSLVDSGFDLRQLIRTVTGSRVYQQSSVPNETNRNDEQNYSRALWKRLDAEVLLDAVCQVTGVPEKFDGLAPGPRAIQLWDSHVPHYFLKIFGRPVRQSVCDCERNVEPSVAQVLHLLNSKRVNQKISHEAGRIARMVRDFDNNEELLENLYLTIFTRLPPDEEKQTALSHLRNSAASRRAAAEDLAWSMMNSLEFVFNR